MTLQDDMVAMDKKLGLHTPRVPISDHVLSKIDHALLRIDDEVLELRIYISVLSGVYDDASDEVKDSKHGIKVKRLIDALKQYDIDADTEYIRVDLLREELGL